MNRFPKAAANRISKSGKLVNLRLRKPINVANSGFQAAFHDCTSGLLENQQESVSFFREAA
jgi:hypothetical protein